MGIPAILSGILTQLGLYSINLKIMGKANQAINVDKFDLLVSLRFIKGVPFFKNTIFVVAVVLIALILILYWFFGTELGCSIRATGCNDKMARAQGINTDFNRVLCLMLSNGLVAFSGALLAQYQGFSDVQMGRGAIVIGLAAVIIGEAAFGKIFHNFGFRLLGVALGSIIYYLVLQVVIWRGIDTDLLKLLSAWWWRCSWRYRPGSAVICRAASAQKSRRRQERREHRCWKSDISQRRLIRER